MNRQTLTDARYHMIGTLDRDAVSKQTMRDSRNRIVGYYDPRTNLTKDARFHTASSGNLLASLIR